MEKYANLKALYGYMFTHPGKKLLFMGGEFAQWKEWTHEESLEWHALDHETHRNVQRWVKDLNDLYRREPALHELDFEPAGFEWVDFNDVAHSVVSYLQEGPDDRRRHPGRLQFHARRPRRLPGRRPRRRPVARGPEQRREGVRRQRPGQPRLGRGGRRAAATAGAIRCV